MQEKFLQNIAVTDTPEEELLCFSVNLDITSKSPISSEVTEKLRQENDLDVKESIIRGDEPLLELFRSLLAQWLDFITFTRVPPGPFYIEIFAYILPCA